MLRNLLALAVVSLATPSEPAPVCKRIASDEARQGVASDGVHAYAVDNSRIGKYRISDGRRVAGWSGDPARFPHLNSCAVDGARLVCAASNYPALPHASRAEFFDRRTLRHLRSHDFGETDGSLTVIFRNGHLWWAVFAHYDGKGGQPGKDHRATRLVRMDEHFRQEASWTFPPEVLAEISPSSISGAAAGPDGTLIASGHDRPVVYVLDAPRPGAELVLRARIEVATHGQAIGADPRRPAMLWSISRAERAVVMSSLRPDRSCLG
jgi:hypothetical protein